MTKAKREESKRFILKNVSEEMDKFPETRLGRAVFNCSFDLFSEVDILRGSEYDCFHNSENCYSFLEELGRILTLDKKVIEPIKLWGSIYGDGAGAAYTRWFLTEDEAEDHQKNLDEGWGEPCIEEIDSYVGSGTY